MELNEACEKAARYWLEWQFVPDSENEYAHWLDKNGEDLNPPMWRYEEALHQDLDKMLASPWGRDLLLRAAEKMGFPWCHGFDRDDGHEFVLFDKANDDLAWKHDSRDEYEAVVFAFAEAADAIENAGEPRMSDQFSSKDKHRFGEVELRVARSGLAEPDYGRYPLDAALDYLEIAMAEIDRLRANQVPGRCGECKHWWRPYSGDTGRCGLFDWRGDDPWEDHELLTQRTGFCHKWEPKE